jgi:hypothetical protein
MEVPIYCGIEGVPLGFGRPARLAGQAVIGRSPAIYNRENTAPRRRAYIIGRDITKGEIQGKARTMLRITRTIAVHDIIPSI